MGRVSSRQRRGRSRHDSCAAPRRFGPACLKEGRRMLVANCTLAQGSVGRVPALPGKRPICGVSCRRRPWALTHSTRLKLDPRREDGRLVLQVSGRDGGSLTRCPSLGELAGLGSHQRRCAGRRPSSVSRSFATCAVGRRGRAARSITWMGRSGYGLGELDGGGRPSYLHVGVAAVAGRAFPAGANPSSSSPTRA
jgi:hypothetical protein